MKQLGNLGLGLTTGVLLLVGGCPFLQSAEKVASEPARPIISADPDLQAEISEDIDALVASTVVSDEPGVAVLVMADQKVLYAEGYGVSDIETQTPITPETVFDLASVSKQMTAIAILILSEQGDVQIDAPIVEYLPDFQDPNSDQPILLSDLLHHTSGLADYTSDAWDGSDTDFATLDLEAQLTWLNQQATVNRPGGVFEYNNSGYALLALIVQRVSGQSFAQFMEAEIFAPAGMSQTQVYQRLGQVIPNQATGYIVDDNGEVERSSFPSVIAGDGNVFSSLTDLAQYDTALRQNALVSSETLALAFAPGELADGSLIEDDGESYGMGWQIASGYVHHSGGWLGTSTYYRYYQGPEVSIIVLSNDENYDPVALGEDIAELLFP
ncbi:MAG: serine hydrolase domain-containing protein [Leptolyngbyaceae cyanobacterium]